MDPLPTYLTYFLANAGATVSAIFCYMAIENMQPVEIKQKVHQKLWLVFFLSLLITPVGAWIVSAIIKMRQIAPTLKSSDE